MNIGAPEIIVIVVVSLVILSVLYLSRRRRQ
jgi:hypothetical protein